MEYTNDQKKALEDMLAWVKRDIEKDTDYLYTLNGAAGTGKTTIVKEFINQIDIPKRKIAVTAPTHKAKKVIQRATSFTSETIQKLLGLRPDTQLEKFDVNNPIFNPIAEDTINFYKIVIVDESSMIAKDAFNLIVEKAYDYGVRILFLGDAYQLPPINEEISKVFSSVPNQSVLEEVVRQNDDNPMQKILLMLRDDVKNHTENGVIELIKHQSVIIGEQGFTCLDSNAFGEKLLEYYFNGEYDYNKDYIKFLAYTNESIEVWSKALRERLLKSKAKNLINEGEILTGYNSVISDYKSNVLLIENSEDYVVTSIQAGKSKEDIAGFYVDLETRGSNRTVFIVSDINHFREVCTRKLNLAKQKRYWSQYYNFKNKHLLLENVAVNPNKPISAWGNLLAKKDLYYGYGCTVHKSQGSTYDNVAINLKNIFKNIDISERARLIYVAMSRTRNMNIILY